MLRTALSFFLSVAVIGGLDRRVLFEQNPLPTKQAFVAALIEIMEAVPGLYGDEGARLADGIQQLERGLHQWDTSLQATERAMRAELEGAKPTVAAALHLPLGALYLERGRLDDALREFDVASKLDAARADVHLFRGLAYDAGSSRDEAAVAFRKAWRLDPDNPVLAYLVVKYSQGRAAAEDVAGARRTLAGQYRKRLIERDATRRSPFVTAALLEEQTLDEPEFPPARYAPAFSLVQQRKYDEALARLREAAALDPLTTDIWLRSETAGRAIAAMRDGLPAVAAREVKGALEHSPPTKSADAYRVLGMAYWFDEQYPASAEQLDRAVELNPADERARLALADALYANGEAPRALQVLHESTKTIPTSAAAHWRLGRMYQGLQRDADALREFEAAAATAPLAGAGAMHAAIGRLYLGAADYERAAQAFARQTFATPNDGAAHRQLGDVLLKLGRQNEAMDEFMAVLLIDPGDADAHLAVGQIHLSLERFEEAADALTRAAALRPSFREAHHALGTALVRLGRTQEGRQELEIAESLQAQAIDQQRRTFAVNQLRIEADLRSNHNDHARAADLWRQVVEREPNAVANHLNLARALAKSGQTAAAIDSLTRALALGGDIGIHQELAVQYESLGHLEDRDRERATYERLKQTRLREAAARR